MPGGDMVVRYSVWLAVLCYPAGPAGRLGARHLCRTVWTLGCSSFLIHVIAAFHVHYHWSHTVALEETARQTAELTGRAVGGGLYANYLFAALWVFDAIWWWSAPESHRRRSRWIDVGLHGFMLFILFNGAVVFVDTPLRWLGLAVTVAAIAALVASHAGRSATP